MLIQLTVWQFHYILSNEDKHTILMSHVGRNAKAVQLEARLFAGEHGVLHAFQNEQLNKINQRCNNTDRRPIHDTKWKGQLKQPE